MNRPRLAIVDSVALIARALAQDWTAVEDLVRKVMSGDHADDVIELLARLVAGAIVDLARVDSEDENHIFNDWVGAATEAIGDLA